MMNTDTIPRLIKEAEILIRTQGYYAFTYAELAQRAGVTAAGVRYHFPTKEDLVVVVLRDYIKRFVTTLDAIRAEHETAPARLRAYANLFLGGFEEGMLPFCGALSAERAALPQIMRRRVHNFFQIHLDWLSKVLQEGFADRTLTGTMVASDAAVLLLSTLEGGCIVGWALTQNKPLVLAAFEGVLRGMETQIVVPPKAQLAGKTARK